MPAARDFIKAACLPQPEARARPLQALQPEARARFFVGAGAPIAGAGAAEFGIHSRKKEVQI